MDFRRAKHEALVMFKVTNKRAPEYLSEMLTNVEETNPYNLRNRKVNFHLPRPYIENLRKSF